MKYIFFLAVMLASTHAYAQYDNYDRNEQQSERSYEWHQQYDYSQPRYDQWNGAQQQQPYQGYVPYNGNPYSGE
jgi:hypothetical protein